MPVERHVNWDGCFNVRDLGGVVFHCGAGRDRTGLVSLLLLALAGVAPEEIAAD